MSKSLLYRLFGIGRVPAHAARQIRSEGVVLQDEGLGGSVTFRDFRAPGKCYGARRNWFVGSIALTQRHFLAFKYAQPIIGVPWSDPRVAQLDCSVEGPGTLRVEFDAATFHAHWSGVIALRFSTPLARAFLQHIEHRVSRGGSGAGAPAP